MWGFQHSNGVPHVAVQSPSSRMAWNSRRLLVHAPSSWVYSVPPCAAPALECWKPHVEAWTWPSLNVRSFHLQYQEPHMLAWSQHKMAQSFEMPQHTHAHSCGHGLRFQVILETNFLVFLISFITGLKLRKMCSVKVRINPINLDISIFPHHYLWIYWIQDGAVWNKGLVATCLRWWQLSRVFHFN